MFKCSEIGAVVVNVMIRRERSDATTIITFSVSEANLATTCRKLASSNGAKKADLVAKKYDSSCVAPINHVNHSLRLCYAHVLSLSLS